MEPRRREERKEKKKIKGVANPNLVLHIHGRTGGQKPGFLHHTSLQPPDLVKNPVSLVFMQVLTA